MKKRRDLTAEDFERHPVWLPPDPSSDAVEPHTKRGPVPLMAPIAVKLNAADGSEYQGFALHTKVTLVAPVVLTAGGHVALYLPDGRPTAEDLHAAYNRLESTAERFFPVKVTPLVKTRNEPVWEVWDSFTYRDEDGIHPVS